MMISLFFPFIFLKPPPDNLRGFFLTPPQEMLIWPYQSLVTGILSFISN